MDTITRNDTPGTDSSGEPPIPPPGDDSPMPGRWNTQRIALVVAGVVAVIVGVTALGSYVAVKLTPSRFRVTVTPREIPVGGSVMVRWQRNPWVFPYERIAVCAAGTRNCRVVIPATPNDGGENLANLNFGPGAYYVELRAMRDLRRPIPRATAKSHLFRIVAAPEDGGGGGGGSGDGGGGGGGEPPPPHQPHSPY